MEVPRHGEEAADALARHLPERHLHQRVLAQVRLRLQTAQHQRKNFAGDLLLQLDTPQPSNVTPPPLSAERASERGDKRVVWHSGVP